MKRMVMIVLMLGVAAAAGAETLRSEHHAWAAGGADRLSFEVPVGDVEITGTDGSEVTVEMEIRCSSWFRRCGDQAKEIELEQRTSGTTMFLEVKNYPHHQSHLSVDLRISVPRQMNLRGELGVGDTELAGLSGSVEIESGVGDVEIHLPHQAVRSVHLECGVGSAEMRVEGRRVDVPGFLFLGHNLDWDDGRGDARIDLQGGGRLDPREPRLTAPGCLPGG